MMLSNSMVSVVWESTFVLVVCHGCPVHWRECGVLSGSRDKYYGIILTIWILGGWFVGLLVW